MSNLKLDAFELFATIYPHEAYIEWPNRFWDFFHTKYPEISREKMEEILKGTNEEGR